MDALRIGSDSLNSSLNASPVSENWAIPTNAAGEIPRRCYVCVTLPVYFMLANDENGTPESVGGSTAVTTSIGHLMQPEQPLVLSTRGQTHFMTIGIAGSEVFSITPLES